MISWEIYLRFLFFSESSNLNLGTQIREHEETIQISPSTVHKTTVYESHRTLGVGQPVLGVTSTGFRTLSPVSSSSQTQQESTNEQEPQPVIEEKYEVTVSKYDESGLRPISSEITTTTAADETFTTSEG